jgi:peptide/nickel transport system substrate-binding protein
MEGPMMQMQAHLENRIVQLNLFTLILVMLFGSCSTQSHQHPEKTVFRYNEAAGIVNLDPAFARDQAHIWVCNQLYNGLVQLDDSLNIEPCIAKKWSISEDGLSYTFTLRNDVFFHEHAVFNGKRRRVVANDFVYSFNRLVSSETASPGAWVFGNIESVGGKYAFVALNDTVLEVKLQKPFPPFLGILSMPYCSVLPTEAVNFYGEDFRTNPVGTGPFYLKNWEENIKMVLQKNQDYFERDGKESLPYLDAISISFLIDKMTAFLEFTKGNLDFISGIDPSYKDELLNRNGSLRKKYSGRINLIRIPYLNTEYLGILVDTSLPLVNNNPLSQLAVRKAINYGFDRKKMIRYLRNGIGVSGNSGMIPKGMPAYNNNAAYGYYYDPEKSRELLKTAGYGPQNPVPPISLVTTSDYLDLCKYIQSQLEEVGVLIEIEVAPPAAVIERRAQSRVNFFRASWIADYPDEENYLSLFYSGNYAPSGPNYTHFTDAHFDSLYQQSFEITDRQERISLYRRMDSMVMAYSPVVILYYDEALRFVNKNVIGMTANPINLLNLKKVKKESN